MHNGFNTLKNPWGTQTIHTPSLKSEVPTIFGWISIKIDQKICP